MKKSIFVLVLFLIISGLACAQISFANNRIGLGPAVIFDIDSSVYDDGKVLDSSVAVGINYFWMKGNGIFFFSDVTAGYMLNAHTKAERDGYADQDYDWDLSEADLRISISILLGMGFVRNIGSAMLFVGAGVHYGGWFVSVPYDIISNSSLGPGINVYAIIPLGSVKLKAGALAALDFFPLVSDNRDINDSIYGHKGVFTSLMIVPSVTIVF